MSSESKTVFVFGAGFTKAFLQNAPLLRGGDFCLESLKKKFNEKEFPTAYKILSAEEQRGETKLGFDIERLMTRLDGYMPYDFNRKVIQEIDLLYHDLKDNFVKWIEKETSEYQPDSLLSSLAAYIIENRIDCITFNYDDVLDRALWEYKKVYDTWGDLPYWHPDTGYGFYFPPADAWFRPNVSQLENTSMLLLKLHGSLNWRLRLGAIDPYDVHSLAHFEPWYPPGKDSTIYQQYPQELIPKHLKPERFIVLPVLLKSAVATQPLLRLIWHLTYKKLCNANKVVFIGYSFPRTDVSANFLFGEALSNLDQAKDIKVINFAEGKTARDSLIDSYKEVFPRVGKDQFDFRGAFDWCKELLSLGTEYGTFFSP